MKRLRWQYAQLAAEDLTRMAGLDAASKHSIRALCLGLTGGGLFACEPSRVHVRGEVRFFDDGRPRVFIDPDLRGLERRAVAAHELAHVYLRRMGWEQGDLETRCDMIGAVLVSAPEDRHTRRRAFDLVRRGTSRGAA